MIKSVPEANDHVKTQGSKYAGCFGLPVSGTFWTEGLVNGWAIGLSIGSFYLKYFSLLPKLTLLKLRVNLLSRYDGLRMHWERAVPFVPHREEEL